MSVDVDNFPENRLFTIVDKTKIKTMSKNKLLNVRKCILIELFRSDALIKVRTDVY